MKKILLTICIALIGSGCFAEDILQILPTRIELGVPDDGEEVLEFSMTNSEPVWGVQFELYLPEGLRLQEDAFEHDADRCPKPKRGNYYHSFDYNYKDGRYIVTLSPNGDNYLNGTEGVVFYAYYTSDENIAPGIYPVIMKDIRIIFETTKAVIPTAVSYVIVGEPKANKLYNLGHDVTVPSFVADELEQMSNIVVNGKCQKAELADGASLGIEEPFTAEAISYSTAVSASLGYKTLVLPYDCVVPAGFEAYEVASVTEGVLNMTEVATITANKPVLLKNAGTVELSAENVNVSISDTPSDGVLIGTYEESSAPVGSYVLQNQSGSVAFYNVTEAVQPKVGTFRAYLSADAVGAAKRIVVNFGGETTGLMNLENNRIEEIEDIYSVDGMRIERMKNSIYIVKMKDGSVRKIKN